MTKANSIISRLAPTPSGLLHPGNGVSFLITWALTRAQEGTLLLRIDDLDKERCRDTYLDDIFRTIDWLGIDYDTGPIHVADFKQNWSQHQRMDLYREALNELRQNGQVFGCDCSRRKIRQYHSDGTYPNLCQVRKLKLDQTNMAWRLHQQDFDLHWRSWPEGWQTTAASTYQDAFVVRQKNGRPAYQLASLVDDIHYGINWIVRGEDLQPSSIAQLRLAKVLAKTSFLETSFHHHTLLRGENGEKLSKSRGAGSLQAWSEAGQPPTPLYQRAAELLGIQQYEILSANSLQAAVRAKYFPSSR